MLKNVLKIFGTKLWVSISGLFLFWIIARIMGPEKQGLVSYGVMLVGLLVLSANLGLDASAVYFVNRIGLSTRTYLKSVVTILIISMIINALIFMLLFENGVVTYELKDAYIFNLAIILLFPMDMVINVYRCLFLAKGRIDHMNMIDKTQSISLLLFVTSSLLLFSNTPIMVMYSYVLCRVVVLCYIIVILTMYELDEKDVECKRVNRREILKYSIFPWAGNVLSILSIRLDTIMIAYFISRDVGLQPSDLGLYTVCAMAMTRAQDVQNSIQSAYFPKVAELEGDHARNLAAKMYKLSWLAYSLIFLVLVVIGYPVLLIFGEQYTAAYAALVIMAIGVLLMRANTGILSIYYTAQGKPWIPVCANGVGVIISILLNFLLIPKIGLIGAALSTVGGAMATKIAIILIFLKKPKDYRSTLWISSVEFEEVKNWTKELMARTRTMLT